MPKFNSEAEEADWYHTPAGRRYTSERMAAGVKKGVVETESRDFAEVRKLHKGNPGKVIRVKNGLNIQRTDRVVLDALVERAKAKQGPQTTAVSLRLDNSDLAKARAVAERAGIGYQALLKEIIHAGLAAR
jgi:predicted DNA binding CopG/RHH family protein